MIKVSLVEDDADFQRILAQSIRSSENLELVGVYASAESFMESFPANSCTVVIMDINLPGLSGIECVKKMKVEYPDLLFSMCTVFEDDDHLFESLRAGAVGYILKHKAADSIVESILELSRGGSPISTSIARKLINTFHQHPKPVNMELAKLTKREQEILEKLSQGYRYKEIAHKLFISDETVRTHVRNLYEKLQVQSRTEAINKIYGGPS